MGGLVVVVAEPAHLESQVRVVTTTSIKKGSELMLSHHDKDTVGGVGVGAAISDQTPSASSRPSVPVANTNTQRELTATGKISLPPQRTAKQHLTNPPPHTRTSSSSIHASKQATNNSRHCGDGWMAGWMAPNHHRPSIQPTNQNQPPNQSGRQYRYRRPFNAPRTRGLCLCAVRRHVGRPHHTRAWSRAQRRPWSTRGVPFFKSEVCSTTVRGAMLMLDRPAGCSTRAPPTGHAAFAHAEQQVAWAIMRRRRKAKRETLFDFGGYRVLLFRSF